MRAPTVPFPEALLRPRKALALYISADFFPVLADKSFFGSLPDSDVSARYRVFVAGFLFLQIYFAVPDKNSGSPYGADVVVVFKQPVHIVPFHGQSLSGLQHKSNKRTKHDPIRPVCRLNRKSVLPPKHMRRDIGDIAVCADLISAVAFHRGCKVLRSGSTLSCRSLIDQLQNRA